MRAAVFNLVDDGDQKNGRLAIGPMLLAIDEQTTIDGSEPIITVTASWSGGYWTIKETFDEAVAEMNAALSGGAE